MTETETRPLPEIVIDPTTGEEVNLKNIDQLAEAWKRLKEFEEQFYSFKRHLQLAFQGKIEIKEGLKTYRLRGEQSRVKLTLADDSWDNSLLKEVWNSYPDLAKKYLKVSEISPMMVEVNKLKAETGDEAFLTFRRMLLGANRGRQAMPSIKLEELQEEIVPGGTTE